MQAYFDASSFISSIKVSVFLLPSSSNESCEPNHSLELDASIPRRLTSSLGVIGWDSELWLIHARRSFERFV